jgi:hypothetical protein
VILDRRSSSVRLVFFRTFELAKILAKGVTFVFQVFGPSTRDTPRVLIKSRFEHALALKFFTSTMLIATHLSQSVMESSFGWA